MARRSASARRVNGASTASEGKDGNSNGSKKPGAWAEPTPAQIERAIRDSLLPVVIALEIPGDVAHEPHAPRLPLLECSVNSWQELVELERVVDSLQRPTRSGDEQEETLEGMVFGSTSKPELQLSPQAVNSAHKFTTSLLLRLQSLGLSVRSLLKDRVLVRLPPGFARTNTRKIVEWSAIVVAPATTENGDEPLEWIQRVELPPVCRDENPLERLRHPQLVPVVDEMLQDHATTGRVHVVILRGIPGSGKSSLGREVVTICKAREATSIVCSADLYFETPRGYQFDVKGISRAHELSQKTFREALTHKQVAIVVVDNTHTQKWEYEPYETMAKELDGHVHILEMHCPDVLTSIRMAQRNSHGVGAVKVMAMYLRWNGDDRATMFSPSFHDPLVLENPVTRNPVNNYVAYVGLFLDAEARRQVLERVQPRHSNVIAEHITLFYRPTTQYIRQAPIGKKFKVRVFSIVEDSRGQALRVELDDRLALPCMNKIPHITLSTAQGVSAFYSNELLEIPSATQTPVGDVWELEVTLGIALMAQNRKIVSLTSPFQYQLARMGAEEVPSTVPTWDSLIILDVDAKDIRSACHNETMECMILRHELIRHSCGPHATSQRVVVVRNSKSESEAPLIAALHKSLSPRWIDNRLHFDSVLFQKNDETLESKLEALAQTAKRVTVLSTQPSHAFAKALSGVHMSVKQLPRFGGGGQLSRLVPALDISLTRALDGRGVATTEEACFTAQKAVEVAENALTKCGHHDAIVERVDAALWTHPSSVVEIATTTPLVDCVVEDIVYAIKSNGVYDVTVTEDEGEVALQFYLATKGTQTPLIRWIVARSSDAQARLCDRVQVVTNTRKRIRDELSADNQELFARVTSVVGAVLRGRLDAVPALQLVADRTVLAFFVSEVPLDPTATDRKVISHHVLWSRIVDCLGWLASWTSDQWEAQAGVADKELATKISEALQSASQGADATSDMSETTGSPQWQQKLASLLVAGKHQTE